jgi:hypothetical protein
MADPEKPGSDRRNSRRGFDPLSSLFDPPATEAPTVGLDVPEPSIRGAVQMGSNVAESKFAAPPSMAVPDPGEVLPTKTAPVEPSIDREAIARAVAKAAAARIAAEAQARQVTEAPRPAAPAPKPAPKAPAVSEVRTAPQAPTAVSRSASLMSRVGSAPRPKNPLDAAKEAMEAEARKAAATPRPVPPTPVPQVPVTTVAATSPLPAPPTVSATTTRVPAAVAPELVLAAWNQAFGGGNAIVLAVGPVTAGPVLPALWKAQRVRALHAGDTSFALLAGRVAELCEAPPAAGLAVGVVAVDGQESLVFVDRATASLVGAFGQARSWIAGTGLKL